MSADRELPPDADIGLSVRQTATLIGCSDSRVRRLLKKGALRGYKDGRSVRIYLSSVEAYRRSREIAYRTEEVPTLVQSRRALSAQQKAAIARLRSLDLL